MAPSLMRALSIMLPVALALLPHLCAPVLAAHEWFRVSVLDETGDDYPPPEAMGSHVWENGRISHLVAGVAGELLVVYDSRYGHEAVFALNAGVLQRVLAPTWGEEHVQAATACATGIYIGTDLGLLHLEGTVVEPVTPLYTTDATVPYWPPFYRVRGIGNGVADIACDGADSVWVRIQQTVNHRMFSTDRDRWVSIRDLPGSYPVVRGWSVPADVIVGDPTRPGIWAYGHRDGGTGDIFYVDAAIPGDSLWSYEDAPLPNVAYPRVDKGHKYRMRHFGSAAPEGVAVPQLQAPLIAADITARCWLAEGAEGAAGIHVFDGQASTDITPPPELLKGSQLRQLVCDNTRGELLVATSGAGVLVFDGTQWSEHPLNPLLPTVEGTEMRAADRIAVGEDGSVWVGTAAFLLHWTRGDGE